MSPEVVPDQPSGRRVVRRMRVTDIEAVAEIERRTFTSGWSASVISGQLARETGIALVCEIDGRVVAYLMADMFVDVWHVMNVSVDEPHRRRHVASQLLEAYFTITERRAHRGHTLEVRASTWRASACTGASASSPRACGPATTATVARTP